MSGTVATNVREMFLLEFITADAEVAALKDLLCTVSDLPELVLVNADEPVLAASTFTESYECDSDPDPVEELRVFSGSV